MLVPNTRHACNVNVTCVGYYLILGTTLYQTKSFVSY